MSRLVFALSSCVLADEQGLPWRLRAGQAWDAEDPLVRLHPKEFAEQPASEHIGSTRLGENLPDWLRTEQATREPGEIRPARRGGGA